MYQSVLQTQQLSTALKVQKCHILFILNSIHPVLYLKCDHNLYLLMCVRERDKQNTCTFPSSNVLLNETTSCLFLLTHLPLSDRTQSLFSACCLIVDDLVGRRSILRACSISSSSLNISLHFKVIVDKGFYCVTGTLCSHHDCTSKPSYTDLILNWKSTSRAAVKVCMCNSDLNNIIYLI